ncbi:MAG: sterol desaturase family protein [Betaproteobacteria bacterium]|nr:sterol desaturase family protein [Betaproteobacteria bacterium]PWB61154.1 MAG: sterol desaturase [Betaproteobacteria bacterium]
MVTEAAPVHPAGIDDWEPWIRLGAFLGAFAAMAAWEVLSPRRERLHPRRVRWTANLGLVVLNSLAVRLAFPVAAAGFAALAAERGWGALNAVELPPAVAFAVAVAALDLAIYFQHVMFHAVPLLWRLHRVHHADPDFDVTTGARFHPIEILLSMAIKLAAIALIGAPAAAVLAFEVILNACAMFNHGNVRLPEGLDRALRRVIVTPDMHRIHHSMEMAEANSNYGFNLAWWDRLLGTYRARAGLPQERMRIGVEGLTGSGPDVSLAGMLAMPLQGAAAHSRAPDPRLDGAGEPT